MSYEGMRGQGAAQKAETNMCFCGLCAEGGREGGREIERVKLHEP